MASSARPIIESRHDQMFPRIAPAEIDPPRRLGEERSYRAGDALATAGDVGPGMVVILRGEVAVTQHSFLEGDQFIVAHRPGSFMGELAQLAGRPALVDARAMEAPRCARHSHAPAARGVRRGGGDRRAHDAGAHPAARVLEIADAFVAARFTGEERHRRRLEKIRVLEARYLQSGGCDGRDPFPA